MIVVKQIKAEDTYQIRENELRINIDLPSQFTGDFEKKTFHFGLFEDKKLVSIVSFMKNNHNALEGEQYQLRGMATLGAFQNKGYGKKLLVKTEEFLKDKKVTIIWCNARVIALDFYQKQGFRIIGNEFDIPQIGGHFVMCKKFN